MQIRTPLTLITDPLGSGKTILLRHILATVPQKIAILMNQFGEIAIDSKIIAGKNVQMADLGGGYVCCSLLGQFEAAVDEIIHTVDPDVLVVETTGVAKPDGWCLSHYKDSVGLLLRLQHAEIEENNGIQQLTAVTRGGRLDSTRHQQRVDVKAVYTPPISTRKNQ